MIFPTNRAVLFAVFGAILSLGVIAASTQLWALGLAWPVLTVVLFLADGALSSWPSGIRVSAVLPETLQVGDPERVDFDIGFDAGRNHAVESKLETNELITVRPIKTAHGFELTPLRRGLGQVQRLHVRWQGPLGFAFRQHAEPIAKELPITSFTRTIEKEATRVLIRENLVGEKQQREHGEGSEFDSLQEFQPGMDSRSIDWKHSARHNSLLSRRYQTERNNSIVFAIDTGRLMSAPARHGVTRLDQALNAALMMSFVSLKLGDRVGFFAFDAKPHLTTGTVSGVRSFPLLQTLTAGITYSTEEANYTLALSALSAKLQRRSLIVVFTDFVDTTGADLMLTHLRRLMDRHLIVFVAFRDSELEEIVDRPPQHVADVTRAVVADTLLLERELVLTKLEAMGAHVVEAPSEGLGISLINQYLRIKKLDLL